MTETNAGIVDDATVGASEDHITIVDYDDLSGGGFLRLGTACGKEAVLIPPRAIADVLSEESVELYRLLMSIDALTGTNEIRDRLETLMSDCFEDGRKFAESLHSPESGQTPAESDEPA